MGGAGGGGEGRGRLEREAGEQVLAIVCGT